MSSGLRLRLAALLAAAFVVIAGLLWMALSAPQYESRATLVLTPGVSGPDTASELLNSVLVTGTVGTYEHYLASSDRVQEALPDEVDISVRAVPDTRVISIRTIGPREEVTPALRAVLALRSRVDDDLGGLWRLDAIQTAQAPQRAGLSPLAMLAAVFVLAALAALAVLAAGHHLRRRRARERPADAVAEAEQAEHAPTVRVLP